ncbi:hypothetical protein [Streptomyces sp. NPDC057729]|uniref:hypothetical protein n=1 Tax=Streptomyces sp. NPDC057729 TaxID=3346230 RepID=UPI00368E66DB
MSGPPAERPGPTARPGARARPSRASSAGRPQRAICWARTVAGTWSAGAVSQALMASGSVAATWSRKRTVGHRPPADRSGISKCGACSARTPSHTGAGAERKK